MSFGGAATALDADTTAIIGAGLSGLRCAAVLQAAGQRVTVLDKSGDSGGRLATRRRSEGSWNHGAPTVIPSSAGFREALEGWVDEGSAQALGTEQYTGLPDMRELTRPLARSLPLITSATVTTLEHDGDRWLWRTEESPEVGSARTLVLAIPAPQAARLLEEAQGLNPAARGALLARLATVTMAPCWTLLLGLETPATLNVPANDPVLANAYPAQRDGEGDGSGAQPSRHWVVHATAAWSRRHLELDRSAAAESLTRHLNAHREDARQPHLQVEYLRAHRWRYARTEQALGAPCLWMPELRLGLAGDWCLGPDAEHAFNSGGALADAMLAGNRKSAHA